MPESRALAVLVGLGTGALLTLMLLSNAEVGRRAGPLAASLVPHATGTAVALLLLLPGRPPLAGPAPAWAYLGGLSGAATVALTTVAANSALALSGTLALGLVGQVAFARGADRWGWLGQARAAVTRRDALAALLIVLGSLLVIRGAA